MQQREIKFRAWNKEKQTMVLDVLNEIDGASWLNATDFYEVMQYTGLKDKNGKEIYEGDILQTEGYDSPTKPISWQLCGFTGLSILHELQDPGLKKTEVIGNIYENKELLK